MNLIKTLNGLLVPTSIGIVTTTNSEVLDLGLSGNKYDIKIEDQDDLQGLYILTDITFGDFSCLLKYDILNPSGFVGRYSLDNWVFFNEVYGYNYVANPKISFKFNFNAANQLLDEKINWINIYTFDFNEQCNTEFDVLNNKNVYEMPYAYGHPAEFNNGTMETDYKFYFGVILNNKDLGGDRSITDWMQICAHKDENGNIVFLNRFNIKNWPPDYPPSGEIPSLGFYVALKEKLSMVINSPPLNHSAELRTIRIVNKHLEGVIY